MISFDKDNEDRGCQECGDEGFVACPECKELVEVLQFQAIEIGTPGCAVCHGYGLVRCRSCARDRRRSSVG